MFQHSNLVLVKMVKGKGRGVFARRAIHKGTIIEKVPVILVPISFIDGGIKNPKLDKFVFMWDRTRVAIALGYGSLYNHSYRPNAHYEDGPGAAMIYRAIRNIAEGEEITINYNGDPEDKGRMGFKVM